MTIQFHQEGGISPRCGVDRAGSVLIIVLWVAFGLVSLALYFASTMAFEFRAADNRVAATEAEQAIAGAARYLTNILANGQQWGTLPDTNTYRFAAVPVGAANFWLIGRGDERVSADQPVFALVDEASKLNLNAAWVTADVLALLPRMTPELAAAIIDWRDTDENVSANGAESETYLRLSTPYRCKNGPFETVDELRLVNGAYLDVLYGEDANLNGVLDSNENDGDVSPPSDNRDGRLDRGILDYVTVYSHEPATTTNSTARLNVASANFLQQLAAVLGNKLGTDRANQVLRRFAGGGGGPGGPGGGAGLTSVLQFYIRSGLSADEFAQIENDIRNPNLDGLINVNTASETVLGCVPGIGVENAATLVAYRQSHSGLNSVAWVKEAVDQGVATQAGPYLTGKTYQFTADIAAVGHFGRGYCRIRYVLDTSESAPKILYRQDLTHMGWALGRQTRAGLMMARATR
jgi:type II secretory pathway component PulK